MQPQGSSATNTDYVANLTAQINASNVCGDIQAFATQALADINAEITAVQGQLTFLSPLTQIPTDLGSVITWISNQAAPYIQAYDKHVARLAALAAEAAALTAALEAAAARIIDCSVTIPSPLPTTPPA